MDTHDVNYYLHLPYHIEVIRDANPENPGWVATVIELPGCITQADSFEEIHEMITNAMSDWIETALEENIEIPEPRAEEEYSGKFNTRVPKSLHRKLVEAAECEGVSLNQWINTALAEAVGGSKNREAFIISILNEKVNPLIHMISNLQEQVYQLREQGQTRISSQMTLEPEQQIFDEYEERTITETVKKRRVRPNEFIAFPTSDQEKKYDVSLEFKTLPQKSNIK